MSEQRKRELLEAAERAMALWRARPLSERVEELKRIGILDEQGVLSERYGGPGQMTEPQEAEDAPR
jgi:hypothetical protein